MRRAILQKIVNLLVARMLADEHPDSSLRHVGIGGEERLQLQVKGEVLKEMLETSRKCRRRTHILSSILSWWWGAGCPQDRILQLTQMWMSLPEASMYIEESDYSTSYLEAWQARTVRESKTEQRTASLEKETVLASQLGVRSLPTSILTPNSWH